MAKTPDRKFKHCMLHCGSKAKPNQEHIFTKGFRKRIKKYRNRNQLPLPPDVTVKEDPSQVIGGRTFSQGQSPLDLSSYCFCPDCNEMLGRETGVHVAPETLAINLITELFTLPENHIPSENLNMVKRYFQRIGLIIDLETAKYDSQCMERSKHELEADRRARRNPPALSQGERVSFREGHVLDNIRVYAVKYDGLFKNFMPIDLHFFGGRGGLPQSKSILYMLDKLCVLILVGDTEMPVPEFFTDLTGAEGDLVLAGGIPNDLPLLNIGFFYNDAEAAMIVENYGYPRNLARLHAVAAKGKRPTFYVSAELAVFNSLSGKDQDEVVAYESGESQVCPRSAYAQMDAAVAQRMRMGASPWGRFR